MKRTFPILIIFSALACAVFFTGCQDVIFAKIMGEVELEDATITGRVNAIVRCKLGSDEYLFIQNGRVYGKTCEFRIARRLEHYVGRTAETFLRLL